MDNTTQPVKPAMTSHQFAHRLLELPDLRIAHFDPSFADASDDDSDYTLGTPIAEINDPRSGLLAEDIASSEASGFDMRPFITISGDQPDGYDRQSPPDRTAMTDAETEAVIAEYLSRKLAKVQARTKLYCKIDATFTSIPEYGTRFKFGSYISGSDYHSAGTADASVDETLASIGDVRIAARFREEAAAKIAQAEQIEAAAMEGEVAK